MYCAIDAASSDKITFIKWELRCMNVGRALLRGTASAHSATLCCRLRASLSISYRCCTVVGLHCSLIRAAWQSCLSLSVDQMLALSEAHSAARYRDRSIYAICSIQGLDHVLWVLHACAHHKQQKHTTCRTWLCCTCPCLSNVSAVKRSFLRRSPLPSLSPLDMSDSILFYGIGLAHDRLTQSLSKLGIHRNVLLFTRISLSTAYF